MATISARIPDEDEAALEAAADLLDQDKSSVIRQALRAGLSDLRIREAVGRYQAGEASTHAAARIAGVSLAEWLAVARDRNLTVQLTPADVTVDADAAREL